MYEVVPKTRFQLELLQGIHRESKIDELDFWVPPRGIGIPVQISVPPSSRIIGTFRLMGMETQLIMDNVQRFIDQQNKVDLKFKPKGKAEEFDYGKYHSLSDVSKVNICIEEIYQLIFSLETIIRK